MLPINVHCDDGLAPVHILTVPAGTYLLPHAAFRAYPPLALSHACRGACVDVFAPGVSILSAVAGSDSAAALKTGTSMAGAACVSLP